MRIRGKLENYDRGGRGAARLVASIPEGEVVRRVEAKAIFKELKEKVLREEVLTHGARLDGRERHGGAANCRPCPAAHPRMSAVSTRGEYAGAGTYVGTADDAQKIESFEGETWKSFMLHYNFPTFSVGRSASCAAGRREVGHGALAERSLTPSMPAERSVPPTPCASCWHPRVERLLVHGVGVWRLAGDDGCRGAD